MAYTLTDHYRPLRLTMRLNGLLVGIAPGLFLLLAPKVALVNWGLYTTGLIWPVRLAGAVLCGLGLLFVLTASQEIIGLNLLLSMTLANSLVAIVLLVAYLQQEMAGLAPLGRALFVLIFLFCLAGAITPLRYFRAEYRL